MDLTKVIEDDLRLNADVVSVERVKLGLLVETYGYAGVRYLIRVEEL